MSLSENSLDGLSVYNSIHIHSFVTAPEVELFLRAIPKGSIVEIDAPSPVALVGGVLAVLASGLTPAIGGSGSGPGRRNNHHFRVVNFNFGSQNSDCPVNKDILDSIVPPHGKIVFQTSGSTGDGLQIEKSLTHLILEVHLLKKILEIDSSKQIVSLVPPQHVYGFLYGVLLPLVTGCDVHFAQQRDGLLDITDHQLKSADLIVTVPALWPLLRRVEIFQYLRSIVTSGSPFGERREREFLELQAGTNNQAKMLEVMGSTETGGIGYRSIGSADLSEFNFFDGVSVVDNTDGSQSLLSPFIDSQHLPFLLADRMEVSSDGSSFKHLGREDRVFKWASKRFSLTQLERDLSVCAGGAASIVYFEEDTSQPHGGILRAFIESSTISPQDIYTLLREKFPNTPHPTSIAVVEIFPKNPMGKVTKKLLLEASG